MVALVQKVDKISQDGNKTALEKRKVNDENRLDQIVIRSARE